MRLNDQEKEDNINTAIKLLLSTPIVAIVISVLKISWHYRGTNLPIFSYLDAGDLIMNSLNDLSLAFVAVVFYLLFTFVLIVGRDKGYLLFYRNLKKLFIRNLIIVMSFFLIAYFIDRKYKNIDNSVYAFIFTSLITLGLVWHIVRYVRERSPRKYKKLYSSFALFVWTLTCTEIIDAAEGFSKKDNYLGTIIYTSSSKIDIDSSNTLLGFNKNYVFVRNAKSNDILIIPHDEVKSIVLKHKQ